MRKSQSLLVFSICICSSANHLFADVFELSGGGTITGKLLNDAKSEVYKIQTSDGAIIEISSGKIKKGAVLVPDEVQKIYKSIVGKEETAELHKAISLELNREYKYLADAHRERIVELDPSDENWNALGSHYPDPRSGEWIPKDIMQQKKGLLKAGRGWDTPQSQAILKYEEKQKLAKADIEKKIAIELRNLTEKTPRAGAAADFFNKLNDPAAIPKLFELIKKDHPQTGLFMEILARMPGTTANWVFLQLSMQSTNAEMVSTCLELLNRTPESREIAFQYYLGILIRAVTAKPDQQPKPQEVEKAAANMQGFADKRAVPTLVECLWSIRSIKQKIAPSQTADKNGNVQMGTGTTIEQKVQDNHPSVLQTLVEITGEDFKYNKELWRDWYARTFAKSNLNLRRDE